MSNKMRVYIKPQALANRVVAKSDELNLSPTEITIKAVALYLDALDAGEIKHEQTKRGITS